MEYITGLVALCTPCELASCGKWNATREDFANLDIRKSEDSILGDMNIEKDRIIPYHDVYELYNVADHVRVYLDALLDYKFDELEGMFISYINDGFCRKLIFNAVEHKMKSDKRYDDIVAFMKKEFGNAWDSYKANIESIGNHVNVQMESIDKFYKRDNKNKSKQEEVNNG